MTLKYIFIICFFFILPPAIFSKIVHVNRTAAGLKNGTSWKDAFTQLLPAMQSAEYGDEIWMAQGMYNTYNPDNTGNPLVLKNGVKLYGGFRGDETEMQQRRWKEHKTTLTTFVPDLIINLNDSFFISPALFITNTDETTLVDGFTFYKCNAPVFPANTHEAIATAGGGILIYSESPENPASAVIRNCTFSKNSAIAGAGIAVNYAFGGGTVIVEKCIFEQNYGSWPGSGGGMDIRSLAGNESFILIDSCLFLNNKGNISGALSISNTSDQLQIVVRNTRFEGNTAELNGPVNVSNSGANRVLFQRCSFIRNETYGAAVYKGRGGGLFALGCRVEECLFHQTLTPT